MIRTWTEEKTGNEARQALKAGIKRVADPVSVTIGAKGRNVGYVEYGHAKATNDGISVARRVWPKDPFERIGSDYIKEAGESTVAQAGDGTSVTTILAAALVELGDVLISKGKDPMELRTELEEAAKQVILALGKEKVDVKNREDILNVARVSVEDEEMAQIIADAVERAGKHGLIMVEEGAGYGIEKEETKGYFWERGYVSPYMVTNADKENLAILEDCPVIVTDRYMNLNKDLIQTLDELKTAGAKSALVIVDRCEGELLQSLILNKAKSIFTTIVVYKPGTLEELEDIAAVTGAAAVTKDKGIKNITAVHVGKAKRVIVSEGRTTIIAHEESPEVAQRLKGIDEALAEQKKKKGDEPNDLLVTRRAKLADGVVVLRAGAQTEMERKYKKDKLDDAVAAAKAATEEGIVPGGGNTLAKISSEMDKTTDGAVIMAEALLVPRSKILNNAGMKDTEDDVSYNVKTGKKVKDMFKEGIIDPKKVLRCAVENATSCAGIVLTVETLIADFVSEGKEDPQE